MEFNEKMLSYLAKLRKYAKEVDKNKQDAIVVKNRHNDEAKSRIDMLNGYA